jgi:hypothetical protein
MTIKHFTRTLVLASLMTPVLVHAQGVGGPGPAPGVPGTPPGAPAPGSPPSVPGTPPGTPNPGHPPGGTGNGGSSGTGRPGTAGNGPS